MTTKIATNDTHSNIEELTQFISSLKHSNDIIDLMQSVIEPGVKCAEPSFKKS